jgi:hypothetical protein
MSMPGTASFSPRQRVLPCDSCTAPITVPIEGGEAHCPRCRTALLAPPRPDTTVPRSSSGDEAQRRERLRAQDGRPTLPPVGLEQMVSGGGVPAHKIQEATLIWAATRKQLASQPADVAAAERLVWLTAVLVNTLLASNDEAGIRALAEGALEVLMLPRHRQTMRTRLSRMAARAGDVDGAQKWLAGCDPASEDLEMDSAYRLSQAFVDTAQRNPDGVLAALGDSEQDVPIEDTMDALAAVLRANAWEQRGDVPRAKQLLARFMTSGGGLSNAVESIVAALPPQWQVCAQSMQSARSVVREQVGARAAGGTGGEMIGLVIMVAGCVPLLMLGVFAYQDQFQLPMLTMLLFPLLFGSWACACSAARAAPARSPATGCTGAGASSAPPPPARASTASRSCASTWSWRSRAIRGGRPAASGCSAWGRPRCSSAARSAFCGIRSTRTRSSWRCDASAARLRGATARGAADGRRPASGGGRTPRESSARHRPSPFR